MTFPILAVGRVAHDERGSLTPGFVVTAGIAAVASLMFMFASQSLAASTTVSEQNNAMARAAQETCTQVYVAAQDPTTNSTLRSVIGGTYTYSEPQVAGSPLPVTVKIAAANQGMLAMDISANGVTSQANCPIPSSKPAYNSTKTVP